MNDRLWKIIQISSFVLAMAIIVWVIFTVPRVPKPDGGWKIIFPSVRYQIVALIPFTLLTLTWAFATYVRKEGEVSIKAAKRAGLFLVGFAIFYLFLQIINP